MTLDIVVGAQWGDEGKGRFVDLLSADADIVARFNGGDNAGHTVNVGEKTFKLHLIPSGITHPHTIGVMGGGMVINPVTFMSEVASLQQAGLEITPERLVLSFGAHIITPAHKKLDEARELALGNNKIGTTKRGIGPAYADKISRTGLRLIDMLQPENFYNKVLHHIQEANHVLEDLYKTESMDDKATAEEFANFAVQMSPYIGNVSQIVLKALKSGKKVLAEAAQGVLLDLDLGTYPYVTSSSCAAPAVLTGLNIGVQPINDVIGITKVFQTRVGEGPFPTELFGKEAERLRGTGSKPWDEFGTTTGRPRRVGWLDGMLLRYTVQTNSLNKLALSKMDILSGLPKLKICTAYRMNGKEFLDLPFGVNGLEHFEPVYEELPGWEEDITGVRKWEDLPAAAQDYIKRIETLCQTPVKWVSVGPERDQVVKVNA